MVDAELHDGGSTSFTLGFLLMPSQVRPTRRTVPLLHRSMHRDSDGCRRRGFMAHASNIFPAGYEFESGKTAIS
jgi:hypothetical protein